MLKFLFITDSHDKVRGPSSRTDNYAETVLRKFTEVGEVAKREQVTAILHGGDLFDSPRVADSHKGDLGRLIRSWGIDMYVVPGNHDLYGYAISSLDNTSLGLFFKHGICKPLTRAGGPVKFTDGKTTVSFTGQEYHMELDHRDPALDYYVEDDFFVNHRVLLIHSMLLPQAFIPDQAFTQIDDVPVSTPTSPDLIIAGHYHPGWPTVTRGGTTFMNIGSMLRTDAGWDNMNRDPQYLIIEVDSKKGLVTTAHNFQSALPSSVVLDRTARDASNARSKTLEAFRNTIDQKTTMQGMDVVSIMDSIATANGLPAELRDVAVKRVEGAEQLVDDADKKLDAFSEKPGPYSITRVEAVNFQSWERLDVDFSTGLNVIVGPSDNGKSAILRAIRYCLYNEPKGADFIRWGAGKHSKTYTISGQPQKLEHSVSVSVTFSDGTVLTRARTDKSSGYYVVEAPGKDPVIFKGFSHNPPPDIFNATQMPKIHMAKGIEKSLNLQTQHEGAFLLSDEASVRAGAIGRLTGVQVVDAAIGEISKEIANNQREVKSKLRDRERLTGDLAEFLDLEQEQQVITQVEVLLGDARGLDTDVTLLTEATSGLYDIRGDMAATHTTLTDANQRLAVQPLLEEATVLGRDLAFIEEAGGELARAHVTKATASVELAAAGQWLAIAPTVAEAGQLLDEINYLNDHDRMLVDIESAKGDAQAEIGRLPDYDAAQQQLLEARDLILEIDSLESTMLEQLTVSRRIETGAAVILERGETLQVAIREYADLLQELGTCPTCSAPVSDHVLTHILDHHLNEGGSP